MSRPSKKQDHPGPANFPNSHDILMNAPVGIFTSTPEGRFLSVNPATASKLGYDTPQELIDSVTDIASQLYADPADREEIKRLLSEKGELVNFECRFRRKDGTEFWASINAYEVRDKDGNVVNYQGFVADISERKRAEEDLRKREARTRLMYESTPAMLYSIDSQGSIIRVSDTWLEKLGYSREEVLGLKSVDFLTPESRQRAIKEVLPDFFAKGWCRDVPYQVVAKDGHVLDVLLSASAEYDENGNFLNSLAVMEDITDRKQAQEALRESEAKHRTIIQVIPDMIIKLSKTGQYLDVYVSSEDKLALPREELLKKNITDIFPEQDSSLILQRIEKALDTQELEIIEYELEVQAGKCFFEARAMPVGTEEVVCLVRDITDRKRAEEALKESEKQYRTIFQGSRDGYVMVDIQGMIIDANQAFCSMLGFTLDELKQMKDFYTITPERWRKWESEEIWQKRLLGQGYSGIYEKEYIRADGQVFPVELQSYAVYDEDRNIKYLWGVARDITERKRAEEVLRKSEERFRSLFENSPTAYQSLDEEGRFIHVNNRLCELLGYSSGELLGKPFSELWSEETKHLYPVTFEDFKLSGCVTGELELVHKDGTIKYLLLEGRIQHDSHGKFVRTHCILTDISERKMAEQALLAAKEQAEAANLAKSEFLANMSHEIRTPINGIMGMMQLLQMRELDKEQKEYVDLSITSAKRLTRLLSDILDLSRVEAGKMTVQEELFSLIELKNSVNDLFSITAKEKGVFLDFSIDHNLPETVIGDSSRVSQIMFNLVGNAIKYSDHGTVTMDMMLIPPGKDSDIRILFTISDSGIGIPDDKIEALFKPFVQVEGSYTRKYEGAGLGLAIVQRLVDLMDGTINITSKVGEGTSIYVVLPFKLPEGASVPKHHQTKPLLQSEKSLRILLAEDDPSNQYPLQKLLEMMGHTVTLAENGRQVLDLLKAQDFDVILMDIRMPVMDGVEAARIIRSSTDPGIKKDIPIIALTAYAMRGDREKYLEAGMNDYLAKPVDMKDLEKALLRLAK